MAKSLLENYTQTESRVIDSSSDNKAVKVFFEEAIQNADSQISVLRKQLIWFALFRLLIFFGAFSPFFFERIQVWIGIVICMGMLALFLFLVSRYTDLKIRKKKWEIKKRLCADELLALDGDITSFSGAEELINPQHVFSYDMDFFGKKSVFQSINRTSLSESKEYLAELFLANSISDIAAKQIEVKQFQNKPEFCLNYRVALKSIDEPFDQKEFLAGIRNYVRLLPAKATLFSSVYSAISAALFILVFINVINWQVLLLPFFGGLAITGFFLKKTSQIQIRSAKISGSLDGISDALEQIENESDLNVNAGEKKSDTIRKFRSIISSLDQGNNIFFALFANGFFLWTLKHASRAEQWILKNNDQLDNLCLLINKTDALVSMGNYAFTHPQFTFPEIVQTSENQIEAIGLGHPLLDSKKCVKNDFLIKENNFLIITGANMAGKSTFLRSVGVSIIMANAGLPVCSEHYKYKPVKLISSMRSSDSLVNDESYFFAELKRLKMIVDTIESEPYFIILDEILKGTNSKDKEDGSRKFLQRLSSTRATGLIATHDLSLCELEKESNLIHNYYFDAEITEDKLHFDYRMKKGVCQNMNASFLLRQMKIV